MYIVRWCDRTGCLQERQLNSLEDAWLEAKSLAEDYEPVTITKPDGSCYQVG